MTNSNNHHITVEILGRRFQISCPANRVQELQNAAVYLDKEMREIRDSGKVVGIDRIAVITALNLAHRLSCMEKSEFSHIDEISERINDMQKKIEECLTLREQTEL